MENKTLCRDKANERFDILIEQYQYKTRDIPHNTKREVVEDSLFSKTVTKPSRTSYPSALSTERNHLQDFMGRDKVRDWAYLSRYLRGNYQGSCSETRY